MGDKHFTFLQIWVKLKYSPGTCAENALLRSGVEVESTDWRHPTLTYIDARGTHSPPLFHLSVPFPLRSFALFVNASFMRSLNPNLRCVRRHRRRRSPCR